MAVSSADRRTNYDTEYENGEWRIKSGSTEFGRVSIQGGACGWSNTTPGGAYETCLSRAYLHAQNRGRRLRAYVRERGWGGVLMSSQAETQRVFTDLEVGDKVRWESWSPGSGRREYEGRIVETDLEHPVPGTEYALRRYKAEHETGWAKISSGDITEVLD